MPKPKALSGRIALITGSAGGIGKAIAKKFAEEGACVIVNDNDSDRLSTAATEFQKSFGKDVFTTALLDVTNSDTIRAAFDAAAVYFGGIDIVVNNAGISISKPIEEHTEKDWDLLYDILVKGQFLVTQAAGTMRKQKWVACY
jgi:NAD(P)-dependent dehydrogenase (short-subunit alcohol dehydrogenase family)